MEPTTCSCWVCRGCGCCGKSSRESLTARPKSPLCEDCYPVCPKPNGSVLQQRLRDAFVRVLPLLPEAQEQMDQLLATDIPLGMLTDVVSFMLEIDIGRKETLLAEMNVYRRAQMLLEHLEAIAKGRPGRIVRPASFLRDSA